MYNIKVDVGKAISYLGNVKQKIIADKGLFDRIGKAGVEIIRKLLEPLKRTGSTADSFNYRTEADQIVISSDKSSAEYLASGFSQAPSVDALRNWMRRKAEFSGLDDREANRVAYAIQKSIDKNQAPGPNSTIGKLQPVGQRKYDYIQMATKQLEQKVAEEIKGYFDAD